MSGDPFNTGAQYGWICPRCNTVHAPFVMRCNCTGIYTLTGTTGWITTLTYKPCKCGFYRIDGEPCTTCVVPESTTSVDPPDEK